MTHMHRHRRRFVLAAAASLTIVAGLGQPFVARADTVTVRPNDTLGGIAARTGVSISALERANGLRGSDIIVAGQVLSLPAHDGGCVSGACDPHGHDGDAHGRYRAGDPNHRAVAPLYAPHAATPPAVPTSGPAPVSPATPPAGAAPIAPVRATPAAVQAIVPAGTTVGDLLTVQATAAGVDPALVKAVAWQESGWRMVIASDGGIGIMQLMPDTVTWIDATLLHRRINPYLAADNVYAGVALLHYYLGLFNGNQSLAVAAYHQGLYGVQTQGISAEAARYVANVLNLKQRFGS